MIKQVCSCIVIAAVLAPALASAYETKSGVVKKITVNSPMVSSRSVIIELEGVSTMCSLGGDSGYFNKADVPDTFSSFVSTLLTAQASGRPVIVSTIPGAQGCRIDQVQLGN